MKKLISLLLVVMMLFTAVSSLAELKPIEKNNVLDKFLDETDLATKDLALQLQSGDQSSELVIRLDGDHLHLVTRTGDKVDSHVQFNSTGIYLEAAGSVTLLRYATVVTVLQDITKAITAVMEKVADSIPEEEALSEAEVKDAIDKVAILASAAAIQEQADAATLSSAAMSFVGKFKPEYVLDVKEEDGSVEISLRGEAFATALGEAIDEMMSNPALAELVDRVAEIKGGKTFAEAQLNWAANREAVLETISTMKSTDKIDENGHWVSHFQIGEETAETKALACDTDSWIDVENGAIDTIVYLGFQDEDPFMVYEFSVNRYQYWEKLTAGDSKAEINYAINNYRITGGNVLVVVEGKEEVKADFGTDYLYMKGPKGGISTSVRETWTGKQRYEMVAETAKGEEVTITIDFYQDGDSLVCEMYSDKSEQTAVFKISRIDKTNIEDLSASEKITEITVEEINAVLDGFLKLLAPEKTAAPEAGK
ncbi:MAG: hypothetical protein IKH57_12280 [Clostridia bacterium]|nr:hypothetical protein [Clostridia bacterium]